MKISAALAVELRLLTQALDLPGTDVAETLIRLAADAQTAVGSYLGLSLAANANGSQFEVTVLDEGAQPEHVRTSLLVPLSAAVDGIGVTASVTLVLYAAIPGAFIDLAADLAWVTGRTLAEFRLDEQLTLPSNFTNPAPLSVTSEINQALGVLIGRGSTPEQAERDLHARAARADIDLFAAANLILAAPSLPSPDPTLPTQT